MRNIQEVKSILYTYYKLVKEVTNLIKYLNVRNIHFQSVDNNIFFSIYSNGSDVSKSKILISLENNTNQTDSLIENIQVVNCLDGIFSFNIYSLNILNSIVQVKCNTNRTVDLFSFLYECMSRDFSQHRIVEFKNINLFFSYIRTYITDLSFKDILFNQYRKSFDRVINIIGEELTNSKVNRFIVDYETYSYDNNGTSRAYLTPILTDYAVGYNIENYMITLQSSRQIIYFDYLYNAVKEILVSPNILDELTSYYLEKVTEELIGDYGDYKVVLDVKFLEQYMIEKLTDDFLSHDIILLSNEYDDESQTQDDNYCNPSLGEKNISEYDSFILSDLQNNWNNFLNNIIFSVFEALSIDFFRIEVIRKNSLQLIANNGLRMLLTSEKCCKQNAYLLFEIARDAILKNYTLNKVDDNFKFLYKEGDFLYYVLNRFGKEYTNEENSIGVFFHSSASSINGKFFNFFLKCLEKDNFSNKKNNKIFTFKDLIVFLEDCPTRYTRILLDSMRNNTDLSGIVYAFNNMILRINNILDYSQIKNFYVSTPGLQEENQYILISSMDMEDIKRVLIDEHSLRVFGDSYGGINILGSIISCLHVEEHGFYAKPADFINVIASYVEKLQCLQSEIHSKKILTAYDNDEDSVVLYDRVLMEIFDFLQKSKISGRIKIEFYDKGIIFHSNENVIFLERGFISFKHIFDYIIDCLNNDDHHKSFYGINEFVSYVKQQELICKISSNGITVQNNYTAPNKVTFIKTEYLNSLYDNTLFRLHDFLEEKKLRDFSIYGISYDKVTLLSSSENLIYISQDGSESYNLGSYNEDVKIFPFLDTCLRSCMENDQKSIRNIVFQDASKFLQDMISARLRCSFAGMTFIPAKYSKTACIKFEDDKLTNLSSTSLRKETNDSESRKASQGRKKHFNNKEGIALSLLDSGSIQSSKINSFIHYKEIFHRRRLGHMNNNSIHGVENNNSALIVLGLLGGIFVGICFVFCVLYKRNQSFKRQQSRKRINSIIELEMVDHLNSSTVERV